MYVYLFVLIYLKFNALYFKILYEFNTIFKNFLKFCNTRKYTINNDVLIKRSLLHEIHKDKNFYSKFDTR